MNTACEPAVSQSAPPPEEQRPAARARLAVASVASVIVTTEFILVGFLPHIVGSLHVSLEGWPDSWSSCRA
jgi:predicted MFS family arabinose efflux permease